MNSGKYVFAQQKQFISRYEFDKYVTAYNGDYIYILVSTIDDNYFIFDLDRTFRFVPASSELLRQ